MQANAQVADRLRRGPPPERGRRLDRRGDVQPRALPARLPGLRARHVDDGRDARRPHQPDRKGRSLDHDHAHHHLDGPAQRPRGPQPLAAQLDQDAAPRRPPARRSRARRTIRSSAARAMGLRTDLAAIEQYQRNIEDAQGWMDVDRGRARLDHRVRAACARPARSRAPPTRADQTARNAIADRDRPADPGHQAGRRTPPTAAATSSAARDTTRPRTTRRRRRPTRATTAADTDRRRGESLREIGPGVTIDDQRPSATRSSATVGPGDGKLLNVLRDIADAPARRRRRRAARHGDIKAAHDQPRQRARGPGAQRRADEPPRDRRRRASTRSRSRPRTSSRTPRTPTSPRRMIDFNSQSAAYQAALHAGANIVQSSLMDFLR